MVVLCLFWTPNLSSAQSIPSAQLAETKGFLLPTAIASFGAAVLEDHLYVFGGHTGEAHDHSYETLSHFFGRRRSDGSGEWELLPGGKALQSASLVAADGQLYRIGGMTALNADSEDEDLHSVASASRFDPKLNRWFPMPDLPKARSSHDVVVIGSKIYVIGGWTLSGDDAGKWIDSALVLNLKAAYPKWQEIAVPFSRRALAAAAWQGELYAIGGLNEIGKPSRRVYIFDIKKQQWRSGPELPSMGFGASAFSTKTGLYTSLMSGELYRLSDDKKSWVAIRRLAIPRFFHRLLPRADGKLLIAGGASRLGHLRSVEIIGPEAKTKITATGFKLTWPGRAKNRQAIGFLGPELIIAGGNDSLEQHDFDAENFVDEVWKLSLGDMTTVAGRSIPEPRQSQTFIAHKNSQDNGLLLVGGFGHDGKSERSWKDIWSFREEDHRFNQYSKVLPLPLTQFGATRHGDDLFIVAGLDYDPEREEGDEFRHQSQVWKLSLAKDGEFKAFGEKLPVGRRAFGGTRIDNKYYIFGGMTKDFGLTKDALCLNLDDGKWTEIPSSTPRISPRAVAVDGKIWILGGTSPNENGKGFSANESVEVFDPATKRWSVLAQSLPFSMRHTHVLPFSGRVLLLSTHNKSQSLELVILTPQPSLSPTQTR